MNIILIIIAFTQYLQCIKSSDVRRTTPVFIIDHDKVMSHLTVKPDPFYKVSTAYFADIVHDAIRKSGVVILFIENQFSVEDTSLKDRLGTPYRQLHANILDEKVKYLPKVIEPFKLVSQMLQPNKHNVFILDKPEKLSSLEWRQKVFYVLFEDGKNETRAEVLRRHDRIINEVYFMAKKLRSGPVVAFYTGKVNPVPSDLVQLISMTPKPNSAKSPSVKIVTNGAIFRFVGVYSVTPARRHLYNEIPIVAEETWTSDTLMTKMAYTDFELEFNFGFKDHDWTLKSVALLEGGEEVGRTVMSVGARWNWAFYCPEPLVVFNLRDGTSVGISEYKIQPIREHRFRAEKAEKARSKRMPQKKEKTTTSGTTTESTTVTGPHYISFDSMNFDIEIGEEIVTEPYETLGLFRDTIHCGPFFTVGILAALFVVALLITILSCGVVALLSCQANDRYEDPHGKLLVLGYIER